MDNEWRIARPVLADRQLIATGATAEALRKMPVGTECVFWRDSPTGEAEVYADGEAPDGGSERHRFVIAGHEELPNGDLRIRLGVPKPA